MKKLENYLGKARFNTFIVDPPTMLLFGIAAAIVGSKFGKEQSKKYVLTACVLFQLAFWVLGPLMYFDFAPFAAKGLGNDFMWNGYLMGLKAVPSSWIPTYHSPALNFIATIGWLIQPFFLFWGVKLGWKAASKWKWAR